jgi:hypothetical protein
MIQMVENNFEPDAETPGVKRETIMADMKSIGHELDDDKFDEHMNIITESMGRLYEKRNNLFVPMNK